MMSERSLFYSVYLKDVPRVLTVDIGTDSTKFLLLKNDHGDVHIRYDLLEGNLYSSDESTFLPKLEEFRELFAATPNTLTILSFSKEIVFLNDEEPRPRDSQKNTFFKILLRKKLLGGDISKLFLMESNRYILDMISLFERAGFNVHEFCLAPAALTCASYATLSEDEFDETHALLDISRTQSILAINTGTIIHELKKFPFGSHELLRILTKSTAIPREKQLDNAALASFREEEIEEALRIFFSPIRDFIRGVMTANKLIPKKIVFSGGLARVSRLSPSLSKMMSIPVIVWGMRGSITLNHNLEGQREFVYDEPSLAVCFGMTAGKLKTYQNNFMFQLLKRKFL